MKPLAMVLAGNTNNNGLLFSSHNKITKEDYKATFTFYSPCFSKYFCLNNYWDRFFWKSIYLSEHLSIAEPELISKKRIKSQRSLRNLTPANCTVSVIWDTIDFYTWMYFHAFYYQKNTKYSNIFSFIFFLFFSRVLWKKC